MNRLRRPIAEILEYGVLRAHKLRHLRTQFNGNCLRRTLANFAATDVHVDSAAASIDKTVGGFDFFDGACEHGRRLDFATRVIQVIACRGAHIDGDGVPVKAGQKAATPEFGMQSERAGEASQREHKHQCAVAKRPRDNPAIALGLRIKPVVESLQHPSDTAPLFFLMTRWIPPVGRKHWVERKRNQKAHQNRRNHGQSERAKPLPRNARHEGHRDEHGDDREGGGRNRQADFCSALQRGINPIHASFHRPYDVFANHDGVIDQNADGQ